jgi:hypothetical protein
VCAADDSDSPHACTLETVDNASPEQLIFFVCDSVNLPTISGGNAAWCLSSKIPLAVLAQQWNVPRMIYGIPPRFEDLDVSEGVLRLHFSYFAQTDPDVVLNVLRELRLRCA